MVLARPLSATVGAAVTGLASTGAAVLRAMVLRAGRGASVAGGATVVTGEMTTAWADTGVSAAGLRRVLPARLALDAAEPAGDEAVLAALGCDAKSTSVSMSARLVGGLGRGMWQSVAKVQKQKSRTGQCAALMGAIRQGCEAHAADRGEGG